MADGLDRGIADIAARQHGVFTLAQTRAVGLTRDQRDTRIETGRWSIISPGVYRIAGLPESWRSTLLAACLGATGPAAASHRSAAELWGLPGARTDIVEITCRRWHRTRRPPLVVHETTPLSIGDVTHVDGIPTTTPEQTLLGLAAVVSPAAVEIAFDRALRLELTTRAKLESFVRDKGARGRNGIGVLRDLLRRHDPLAGVPESAMETKLKQLLRRHGLPTPTFQFVIRDRAGFVARVDAAYPELRIAIEYDSYEHHTGKLAIVRDNNRRNRLSAIEWDTVTFTADDLWRDGGDAIRALRVARARAQARSLTDGAA